MESGKAETQMECRLGGLNSKRLSAKDISEYISHRDSFGLGWLLLQNIRLCEDSFPFTILDLSDFSLSNGKLDFLLSTTTAPETLKLGPRVCTEDFFPAVLTFLQRLKGSEEEEEEEEASGGDGRRLKSLIAAKCELREVSALFSSLPPSLERLDLKGNNFRLAAMEAFSARWLPVLMSVDLSDNPLGPLGVRALAEGLYTPLQSLRLARVGAKKEGVKGLAEALKEKRVSSLQTLDLAENQMGPEGFEDLVDALCTAGAVPEMRNLNLKRNNLIKFDEVTGRGVAGYAPLSKLLTTDRLTALEELDLSENALFEEELGVPGAPKRVCASSIAQNGRFPKLRVLNLCGNSISSRETASLLTALQQQDAPRLEELGLSSGGGRPRAFVTEGRKMEKRRGERKSWSEEDEPGIHAFADALNSGCLSQLTQLTMVKRDDLSPESAIPLFRALSDRTAPQLRTLNVEVQEASSEESCQETMKAIIAAVRQGGLRHVENFTLDLEEFCAVSAHISLLFFALGSRVGPGSRLRKLDLRWDCMTDSDGQSLVGLAQILGAGGMPCLEDLSVVFQKEGAKGAEAFGRVLSTGRVPSLRKMYLDWPMSPVMSSFCEGLRVGNCPPELKMELHIHGNDGEREEGDVLVRLTETIRTGHMKCLQILRSFGVLFTSESAAGLGQAMADENAGMVNLEEVAFATCRSLSTEETAESFWRGLGRGSAGLRALRKVLAYYYADTAPAPLEHHFLSPRPLAAVVARGKVPSLSEIKVQVGVGDLEGVAALSACLWWFSPPSLTSLDVSFGPPAKTFEEETVYFRPDPLQQQQQQEEEEEEEAPAVEVQTFSRALPDFSRSLTRLEHLRLSNIQRPEAEFRSLCHGIQMARLASLRQLTLDHVCIMHEEAAGWLSAALNADTVPRLTVLKILKAALTDRKLKRLTDGWIRRPPPPLKELDLSLNRLTDEGALALGAFLALKRLPALLRVAIGENQCRMPRRWEDALKKLAGRLPEIVFCWSDD